LKNAAPRLPGAVFIRTIVNNAAARRARFENIASIDTCVMQNQRSAI
jgi:hypothetical protein